MEKEFARCTKNNCDLRLECNRFLSYKKDLLEYKTTKKLDILIGYFEFDSSIKPPLASDYGYVSSNSFEDESGWMIEGGDEEYYKALEKFKISYCKNFI